MKDKILVFSFFLWISFFSLFGVLKPDNEISYTERRKLSKFPEFQVSSEYINRVDKYFLDQFPYRDQFRSIKALFNYNILNKHDNNDIYLKDNSIYKSNYPTNKESIKQFINHIDKMKDIFQNNSIYMMIIPDKNYYLNDSNFLHIDYSYIYDQIKKIDVQKIDIRNILNENDYYETDTHWKQENLDKVVEKMSKKMNFEYKKQEYTFHTYDKFYGVYYGESAINRKPEILTYVTNKEIDNVRVEYLENSELKSVYHLANLESLDSYEVYLDGASSFIEIYNDEVSLEKELIIFRDSFASSLAPLLIPYYSKITLIDNRYINSKEFLKRIDIDNQEILFMYSTLLVNDSSSLKN